CAYRTCTKVSVNPLVSPATRLVASESKATTCPLAESATGAKLLLLPCVPTESTDTRSVFPVVKSCTKTSSAPLVSPATRLLAFHSKATCCPSAESVKSELSLLPCVPAESTDTRSVFLVFRSCTKMSKVPLVSPGTRLLELDAKATTCPLAESAKREL